MTVERPRFTRLLAAISVLVLGASAREAKAQVPYVANQFTQPYAPLTGATALLQPSPWSSDQAALLPIGFAFTFFGTTYTHVEVGENGVLELKTPCSQGCSDEWCDFQSNMCIRGSMPTGESSFPSPDVPNNLIAPFWDDLYLDSNAPASVVQYRLIGAAPNRELVIEWRNMRHSSWSVPGTARVSFQARLREGTNNVRLAYGAFTTGADAPLWAGRIGIEDVTGLNAVVPLACSSGQNHCDAAALTTLNNQVIEIGQPNTPELMGSIAPVFGAQPGETVTVSAELQNIGRQPTPRAFDVSFYLSTDSVISPGVDALLGTVAVPALAAGETKTATLTVTVPALLPAYYTLGAFIDSSNVITEATKANNMVIASEPFLVGNDLEASFTDEPQPLPPGDTVEIPFTILNRSSAVPDVEWQLFLSLDGALDANDVLLATGHASLPASDTTTIRAQAAVPAEAMPGPYTLIAVVDPANLMLEIDELNNEAYTGVSVGPEAHPTGITAPGSAGAGATVEMQLSIENSGSAVPSIAFALYFSSDAFLDMSDTLVATGTTALPASYETIVPVTVTLPTNLASTGYQIIAVVDPDNLVTELDEQNNTVDVGQIRLIGPDLASDALTGAPIAFIGQQYTLHGVVSNLGGQPVTDFYVSFHLSANQLITATDPELMQVGPFTLQPGEHLNLDPTVTIPAGTTRGQYWFGMISDSTNVVVGDTNPYNNIKASAQTLIRPPAPDFVVTEIQLPATGGVGESFVVQRTLENQGNAPGTVAYDIYLVNAVNQVRSAAIGHGTATVGPAAIQVGVDRLVVPAGTQPGAYDVEYNLDPSNAVDEIVETNNTLVSPGRVQLEGAGLAIATTTLPSASVGLPYEYRVDALGGTGPLAWSLTSGTLPAGIALDGATGRLEGTPTADGQSRFTLRVTDGSLVDERAFTILVASATVQLEIATRAIPPAWAQVPYEYPLTAVGGVPPYTWSMSPALPTGLTVTSSGAISGTTSTTAASRVYTVHVADAVGGSTTTLLSLRVLSRARAVRFGTSAPADGIVGTAYMDMLEVVNGVPPYAFAVTEGALPAGLAIEDARIAGMPTKAGTFAFQVSVTDAAGDQDFDYFVVTIDPAEGVRFVTKGLPFGTTGKPYLDDSDRPVYLKAIATGTTAAIGYELIAGALPAGLTLDPDGRISGTPTAAGVAAFTVRARDALGETDVRAFGLEIEGVPPVLTAQTNDDGCGCTTSGAKGRGGAALFLVLLGGLVLRRARRAASLLAMLLVLGAASTAHAQRDGGVGPDAGPFPGDGGSSASSVQYFTSQRTEAYVARSGGQLLSFPSNDDGEAIVQIPFAFRFWDSSYNQVHVSTNGYVAFDQQAVSFSNTPIPAPNGGFGTSNMIAGYWDDLWTTDVTVYTEGTSPNQILIVQWRDSAQLGDRSATFDMQIWLYEGPAARFEIHYGPNNASVGSAFSASVGYEDTTGTLGASLLPCTPGCSNADLAALPNTVFQVLQDAGTDLTAGGVHLELTGTPLRVYAGVPFDVSSQINSYHGQPIGPFVYSLYLLAQGEVPPGAGTLVFTSQPQTVGAYQSLSLTDAVTIPIDTAQGRYHIGLVVDSQEQITEPDETNNVFVGTEEFIIAEREPDLVVSEVRVSSPSGAPGSPLQLGIDVQNAGNLAATTSWVVVLSANAAPSPEDLVIYTPSAPIALAPGERHSFDVPAMLPSTLRPGRYYVGVIVDPDNLVSEISEVNNIGRTSRAVLVGTTGLSFVNAELPPAFVGIDYLARLSAEGGDGSFVFELVGGTLPQGISFVAGAGELRGRAAAAGTSSLTFRVTSNGLEARKTFALEIAEPAGPLTIVTRSLLPGTVGVAYPPTAQGADPSTQQHILAIGGGGHATFSVTGGTLPAGLTLDPDGYLHGVPAGRGTYTVTVTASDGANTASRDLPITIVEPGRLSLVAGTLPDGALGQPYDYTLFATGHSGAGALVFGLVPSTGDLPPGLVLSTRGELSGTPTHAGTYGFAVEVRDGSGSGTARDSAHFVLTVVAPAGLSIFPGAVPTATVGVAYEVVLEARQGMSPYRWTIAVNGDLPNGLSADVFEENGEQKVKLHGTATELPPAASLNADTGGVVAFMVTLEDAAGRRTDQAFALRVVEATKPAPAPKSSSCACVTPGNGSAGAALLFVGLAGLLCLRAGTRRTRARRAVSSREGRRDVG